MKHVIKTIEKVNFLDVAGTTILTAAAGAILINFFFNGNGQYITNLLIR